MKKTLKLIFLFNIILGMSAFAQDITLDAENRDPAYVENISQRSQKIVDQLKINDNGIALNVKNIIANRYFELNDIYEARDLTQKEIKENGTLTKEQKEAANAGNKDKKDAQLYRTHFGYISRLALYLNDEQIEAVKDGMTFGVLHVTNTATLDMIPSLKEDEKRQIYSWLVEAREYAMDAESSSEKHKVFGKYKGRINNYLSARGYNLTRERAEWEKRIKERGESQ